MSGVSEPVPVLHRVDHAHLGPLEIPEEQLLRVDGLPGFPQLRRLALLEHDRRSPFGWLVSLDDPQIAFAVVSPWDFFPDYEPEPDLEDLGALGAARVEELEVLVIATLCEGRPSLNLAAPLLVHRGRRRAHQAILSRGDYRVRTPLPALQTPSKPQR